MAICKYRTYWLKHVEKLQNISINKGEIIKMLQTQIEASIKTKANTIGNEDNGTVKKMREKYYREIKKVREKTKANTPISAGCYS